MAVDAGTIYSEVRIQLDKLKGDISRVETVIDKFGKKNAQQSEKVKKKWTDNFKQINLSGVAAFAGIGLAVKQAIDIFAKFEQSMANVRSVTDSTAEDFERLENAALEAGETTRFTATQAADALYFLASAGLSAQESISALDGVLKLAGATGSDLASTSSTMAATLSQFSLDADEALRVSNVFAAAISNSQANMEKLASSLKQVGPISGALNISLEETTANLEALFNAGFAGEQAGTGLRNILLDLSDSTGPVIRQLEALGVTFEEVNPREVGLTDAIETLAESGVDLANVFGKRVAAQMLVLAKTGGDALRELQAEITDTNAAAELYAIQNDTLAGSIDFLKSAIESAAIKIVDELGPALRGIVDFLASAVRGFNELPGPIKLVVGVFAGGIPIVLGLAAAFTALASVVGTVAAPIVVIVGSIALLTGVIAAAADAAEDFENRFVDSAKALGDQKEELDGLIAEYERLESKTNKTEEEQRILEETISRLAGILPEASIEFNEYGEAIGIAKDAAIGFSEELGRLQLEQLENQKELLESEKELLVSRADANEDVLAGYREELKLEIEKQKELKRTREEAEKEGDIFKLVTLQLSAQEDLIKRRIEALKTSIRNIKEGNIGEGTRLELLTEQEAKQEEISKIEKEINALRIKLDPELRAAEEARLKALDDLEKANEKKKKDDDAKDKADKKRAKEEIKRLEDVAELKEELRVAGLTDEEKAIDKLTKKVKEFQDAGLDAEEFYQTELAKIRDKYRDKETEDDPNEQAKKEEAAANRIIAATENVKAVKKSYQDKLNEIGKTQLELIEIERKQAIKSIENSEATVDAQKLAIDAVNEYFDAIKDNTANEIFKNNIKNVTTFTLNLFSELFGTLSQLFTAMTQKRLELLDIEHQGVVETLDADLQSSLETLDADLQARLEAAGLLEETKKERLERELQEAIDTGDDETADQLTQDIARLALLSEYEAERERIQTDAAAQKLKIEEEYEKKRAQLEYEGNLQAWKMNLANAVVGVLTATINAYSSASAIPFVGWILGPIAAAAAAAFGAAKVGIVKQQKPEPPRFQTGGIVIPSGPGGVEVIAAENGSSELLLNSGAEGRAFLNEFADIIAARTGKNNQGGELTVQLMVDGRQLAENSSTYYNNGIVKLKL